MFSIAKTGSSMVVPQTSLHLQIVSITVTPGVRIKRYRPAAHGRALPFQRMSSHITVVVDGEKRVAKKPVAKKETK